MDTLLQDLIHLLDCPASEPRQRAIFGTTGTSIFDLLSRPWGVAQLLSLREFLHALIPLKGSGSTTTTAQKIGIYFTVQLDVQH